MFSYSNATAYKVQVAMALKTNVPMSVVGLGTMPDTFMGKPCVSGDNSDIENLKQRGHIVWLKYKVAKGKGINPADSIFVVDMNKIVMQAV
jgi:hypothetical protein